MQNVWERIRLYMTDRLVMEVWEVCAIIALCYVVGILHGYILAGREPVQTTHSAVVEQLKHNLSIARSNVETLEAQKARLQPELKALQVKAQTLDYAQPNHAAILESIERATKTDDGLVRMAKETLGINVKVIR